MTRDGVVVTSSDPNIEVGQPVAGELGQFVESVTEQYAVGPEGARLSWVPTLDWRLLEL